MRYIIELLVLLALCALVEKSLANFEITSYKDVAKTDKDKSLIFAPSSLRECLAMAYLGLKGDAADELRNVLELDGKIKGENLQEFHLTHRHSSKSGGPTLKVANKIYVANHITILESYKKLSNEFFHTDPINLDFRDASSVNIVNQFVEEQTEHKIKKLFEEPLEPDTGAVLVNAIYFHGKWVHSFNRKKTEKLDFHIPSSNGKSRTIKIDTMFSADEFRLAKNEELDATYIELPYNNSDISMSIILPNKEDGLLKLEENLDKINFEALSSKAHDSKVGLYLPKFKVESSLDLIDNLKNIGIKKLFSSADFSDLAKSSDIIVNKVRQKAFIEIDEEGSIAAASTGITSTKEGTKPVTVDHPFLFAIRDKRTTYFIGRFLGE